MKKFIAPILTGLMLVGAASAAVKAAPKSKSKGFGCPLVVGGKCSDHKVRPMPPRCKENPGIGLHSKCRPNGPF